MIEILKQTFRCYLLFLISSVFDNFIINSLFTTLTTPKCTLKMEIIIGLVEELWFSNY